MRSGDCLRSGGKLDLTRGGSTRKYRLSRLEAHPRTSRDAHSSNERGGAGGRMSALFKFVTSLALALIIGLSAGSGARADRRVALVIGNARYQHGAFSDVRC